MKKDRKQGHLYACGVSFSTFTEDEILKLSVVEVKNPQNFDALGYPTGQGVYDPALGPNERHELCATCSQNYVHCPGHLGHIKLPLPVFNPVFFNTFFQILRGSCLSCHRLLAPIAASLLVQAQLSLLDYGLIGASHELEELVGKLVTASDTNTILQVKSTLDNHVANVLDGMDKKEASKNAEVKNVIDCRCCLIKWFIHEYMMKRPRQCPHCEALIYPLHNLNKSRIIISSVKGQKTIIPDKKTVENRNTNSEADDSLMVEEFSAEGENSKTQILMPKTGQQSLLTPVEARKHMRELWHKEKGILQSLFKILATSDHKNPMDIFFLDIIPVPPSRFRPINVIGERKFENPQSAMLSKVVQSSYIVKHLMNLLHMKQLEAIPDSVKGIMDKIPGSTGEEKLQNAWSSLQSQVNLVADSDQDASKTFTGVKQVIEKKEGIFRKNMMGKRVDYAARSVISPDPFIGIDEIGIPEVFAKKLTYPERVTPWNVRELRQLVMNGPNVYPGATLVKNEFGEATLLSKNDTQREAVAKTLLTPSLGEGLKGPKVVHRHLRNGDVLLVNRQPTLHRPSIMAHKARILPGEKTLRLHYSNCKTYNADFDGDEMNVHFPQNELAKAEAELIANVNNHYLVPKDGTPLGGLIQDHIVAGIHMTIRGRFFSKEDYQQLVFAALSEKTDPIYTLSPCIFKPKMLWSGKKIFSTVLKNLIPTGKSCIYLEGRAKINTKAWQNAPNKGVLLGCEDMTESNVIISNGELLCGVLDKAHYGPTSYGLIHSCYELYGGNVSSKILSAMGRLFTFYLRIHGFTLGIEDILIQHKSDRRRKRAMKAARTAGSVAAVKAFGLQEDDDPELLKRKYMEAHLSQDDRLMKYLDIYMKAKTDEINNNINRKLMPSGLLKEFPSNNLQLMVQSGAKGASVNCIQISCLLGQIELEGRRPPLMLSGRTLPSFLSYDLSPRAGGFIAGRFLTGIQPQEYFFHCMAGREGLIDTAVKTSRSGYLQRCLIKHLEGVRTHYDLTVRDSDGSVIQFLYGEDGLDIQKTPFLKKNHLSFMAKNSPSILDIDELRRLQEITNTTPVHKKWDSIRKWKRKNPFPKRKSPFLKFCCEHPNLSKSEMQQRWFSLRESDFKAYKKRSRRCPDPVISIYKPDTYIGSITETLDYLIENYISVNPDNILIDDDIYDKKANAHYLESQAYGMFGEGDSLHTTLHGNINLSKKMSHSAFRDMMYQRVLHSLCSPGESVGLLAAQSIGEPSTQMTLNTFHFAGRGEMNVTLGIPRLREILMVASSNIGTPSLEVPIQMESEAEKLKLKLTKVYLYQVLEDVHVYEWLSTSGIQRARLYRVRINLLPHSQYASRFFTRPSKVLYYIEHKFIKQLIASMQRKFRLLVESNLLATATHLERRKPGENEDDENNKASEEVAESSDEEQRGEDDDAAEKKQKNKRQQEREYEEEEDAEEFSEHSDFTDYDEDDEVTKENKEYEDSEIIEFAVPLMPSQDNEKKNKKISKKSKQRRIEQVIKEYTIVCAYDFDEKDEEWCEITFQLQINDSKIDLMSLIDEEVKKAVIHEVSNIKRAFITDDNGNKMLKTEGVNIEEMFKYDKILDLNKLYSNDIHALASIYGIEAANRAIVKEIQAVFQVYGIHVDPRHLLLIADYMTFSGTYRPFNRVGLESNSSPLQQMSFETTMHFLKSATLAGRQDTLRSPSAQIITGKPVSLGTGSMDILIPVG